MTGKLHLVSVGPGRPELIAPLARQALEASDVVVGYDLYMTWIQPWITGKEIHTAPLTRERERAATALGFARAGRSVALVSSGDIGVYAMAALAFEDMREDDRFDVEVVPGITAANACAALLGAPLSHDFATLSLSDLLCPWAWIETRARHIAQADLAAVFYNVQSRSRQQGVYRILDIMLEHKRPDTVCGVVRNAYRPDQQIEITTLRELPARQFDMLTTLVIGNRYTQRKRDWIFTPRGYGAWDPARAASPGTQAPEAPALPHGAAWVFSGTSDGNRLAADLARTQGPVVVSVASAYGAQVAARACPGVPVETGRAGVEARRRVLRESGARAIVDATHPYAVNISTQLIGLARELGLPYLRYERPSALLGPRHCGDSRGDDALSDAMRGGSVPNGDAPYGLQALNGACSGAASVGTGAGVLICASMADAAARATALGTRIFLATGSRDVGTFLRAPDAHARAWFLRMTPDPDLLREAIAQGIPAEHICAMQGPFTQACNEALWRAWGIDCVVTKDSGDAGGYNAKQRAAAALGVPLLVVARPAMEYPVVVSEADAVASWLAALGTATASEETPCPN